MNWTKKYFPIFQWVTEYKNSWLKGDLSAGLTVGIMLIPQGMAYAMIAGLPPVYGLYASIIPQLIYAIFGTSRQLSVAPVAMDSLLVAAGISVMATEGTEAYIHLTLLLAFFMGAFQLLLGIFRMGFITNLLSKPVISGFTSAAAIIIGINQVKYLLGVELEKNSDVFSVLIQIIESIPNTHLITLMIGIAGIIVIKQIKRIHKAIPGPLIAVVLGVVAVYILNLEAKGVAIVREIPDGLPAFSIPTFELETFKQLIPLALTISVVAFMEAFSVAKALESKDKRYKIDANQELIGLGAANFIGALFQSYPVTGGFSRSAVNQQSGANTPLASIISALVVVLTLLFLTPLFYFLPTAILASVIMVAIINLIDFAYAHQLFKENKSEFLLFMATFLVTIIFSMVPGIVTGVVLSILLLLYRAAYPHIAQLGRLKGHQEFRNIERFKALETWPEKLIWRIDTSLTFINIQYIRDYIELKLFENPKINEIIIDASSISYLDASAVQGMTELITALDEKDRKLILTDIIGPVRDILFRTGLYQKIGRENIYLTLTNALDKTGNEASKEIAMQHNLEN